MTVHSPNPEGRIFNSEYQIYQQEVPSNRYSGRFIYCISMEDTKDNVKTVCILVLKQIIGEEESDGRSGFNYNASMFYINVPLQEIITGQPEQFSDA
jgi:hypothetical protein